MIKAKAAEIADEHIKEKYDWYKNYHRNVYENYDVADWKLRWNKVLSEVLEKNED